MSRRRGYGEGSVSFDKNSGRWIGRLPRDEHGRRAKVTGKTAKEVQAKLRARLQDREQGLPELDARMTVQSFLKAWVRDSLPLSKRASRTIESYEATVRLTLSPVLGGFLWSNPRRYTYSGFCAKSWRPARVAERSRCPMRY
jgi:hypothetical protein